jgi:eukaryotic-like serine/threonine-protein kinase
MGGIKTRGEKGKPVTLDQTEAQSPGEQLLAEEMSLRPTTPPATLPGYRLDRFLGAGTFGQVWFGHDLNTGRPVAIKFYLHRGGVNWSLLSREVKNLVQLSAERSIVQVLDVGWDAEPPFYVMEYLPNGSLEDLLQSAGRLSVTQSVDIFRKICIGLNHCHGRGVLHCDLKPGNILLDSDNSPRLADFGQSRMSNDQSPSLGTMFYMAPEQANLDAAPDARWDVYALGVILYRMLTGKIPHRNDTLITRIDTAGSLSKRLEHYRHAILGDARPTAHRMRRGVDRELAGILDRCIAPDPNHRFANVQQVLAALDQRDQSRARKPLMLLGIVGPLLLMLASGIFAARSITGASGRATEALRTEARTSNQLAARFAARSLENELLRYFQVLEREAGLADTRQILRNVLQSTELTEMRRQIVEAPSQAIANRSQFLHHPTRRTLDDQIEARLASYAGAEEGRPGVSTMFITDAQGTIISIALDTKVDETQLSTGYNFAFRTYFHGGRDDLPRDTAIDSVDPLARPHLSAAFQSTATGLWKLAFSMPIYLDAADQNPDQDSAQTPQNVPRKPDGVFVITTNLGDFESMRDGQLNDQLAVVIEARNGPLRGTILQHPLMDQQTKTGGALAGKRFQVSGGALDNLLNGSDIDYRDPMAAAPGGRIYSGRWLAAVAPITLPKELTTMPGNNDGQAAASTDLLVLVQYRLSKVFEPVRALQRQLLIEGSITLTLIFALTAAMWIYVNRLNDPTRFDDPTDESRDTKENPSDQPTIGVR